MPVLARMCACVPKQQIHIHTVLELVKIIIIVVHNIALKYETNISLNDSLCCVTYILVILTKCNLNEHNYVICCQP